MGPPRPKTRSRAASTLSICAATPRPESLREVLAAVAGRRAVSAGASDPAQLAALAELGVDYLKILTRGDEDIIAAAAPLARTANLLGIALAEDAIDEAAIAAMAAAGFAGVILNTRGGRNLIETLDIASLGDFAEVARRHGLTVGLAGALELPDIPRLLLLEPDMLAFRFDAATIEPIRAQIPPDQRRRARPARRSTIVSRARRERAAQGREERARPHLRA